MTTRSLDRDAKTKRMLELREQGLSYRIIATRLGLSTSTVVERVRKAKEEAEKS